MYIETVLRSGTRPKYKCTAEAVGDLVCVRRSAGVIRNWELTGETGAGLAPGRNFAQNN
jgi:hypothetical protein